MSETRIELDAPAHPRSILVIEEARLTIEQAKDLRERIREAVALDRWPVVLCGVKGPVYWLPITNELTFKGLHEQNVSRARRWHPGFPEQDDWTGGDWATAMAGEAGEACNIVKKLRRVETAKQGRPTEQDTEVLRAKLALELADMVIYADLLSAKYGIDLAGAVREKFNAVSDQYEFPERL